MLPQLCCPAASWTRISKVYFTSRWTDDADPFDDARIHANRARPPNACWPPSC
jgi:tRNA(Arg) A34 adenosine deaminase TadA